MVGEKNYEKAKEIYEYDKIEVLELLPNLEGMDVLELGAGSGRLSGELAKKANTVIATDFMEAFVKENEETNGPKYSNITFRTLDATKLDYPPNTFDMIFSNWLLHYLDNNEVEKFIYNSLMMVKPGGYTYFRESHFHSVSGFCPSSQDVGLFFLRSMKEYHEFYSTARYTDEHNVTYFFEFVFAGNSQTYVRCQGNPTQIYYLWRKTKVNGSSPSINDSQQILDKTLYNEEDMKVYNKVIGNGFVTPGGLDCSKELIVKLNLKANSLVLDVGCGLGGLEAYLVKECDIDVTGLELSLLASQAAVLRMNSLEAKKGHIHIADVAHTNFASNMFDAIFARETLEYIGNKETILKKTQRWLKPNGQLLMGDYCLGKEIIGGDTAALIQSEGLNIIAVDSYIKLLEESGYINVQSEDHSQQYISYLTEDLTKLETTEGIEDNTKKKFSTLWQSLVTSLTNKDLAWTVFVARKPVANGFQV